MQDDQPHDRNVPGQEQRRLPGRAPASDDGDGFPAAKVRFDLSGGVVDAHSFELVEAGTPSLR